MNNHTKQKIGTEGAVELARLLRAVTVRAEHLSDGHFTLTVFTTCVKLAFGTIEDWRELELAVKLPSFQSLGDALRYALSVKAMLDYEQISAFYSQDGGLDKFVAQYLGKHPDVVTDGDREAVRALAVRAFDFAVDL
jgi:hypothetical protein